MSTPFDRVIQNVVEQKYHNHRRESHSDIVSEGIFEDLLRLCPALKKDADAGKIRHWLNVKTEGARGRKVDLFVGEPLPGSDEPNITSERIGIENKSVITAHRNRTNRFDDLSNDLATAHNRKPETILVATILVGVAQDVLNIPDNRRVIGKARLEKVMPRLSSGDQTLWTELSDAVSRNTANDIVQTINQFRKLPTRNPGHTHVRGYDYVLMVPVWIDNVNPPHIVRNNSFGIDVDKQYEEMLKVICSAYQVRFSA